MFQTKHLFIFFLHCKSSVTMELSIYHFRPQHNLTNNFETTINQYYFNCATFTRKYPYPPHGKSSEILTGWGFQKPKLFKGA